MANVTLGLGESRLEQLAGHCTTRPSLRHFNLPAARAQLADMLGEIGRSAEFSTYTKHDITHIDSLLAAADWLIPDETWEHMTVADALIITLSIYVHDLGMLVTKEEFVERNSSNFPSFKEALLEDESPRGVDFRERLNAFDEDDREHFIYEEFVRVHHSHRIETWVGGTDYKQYGVATSAQKLVREVFASLDPVMQSDIALIARSHHLDDLDDLSKYWVSRSYGNDRQDEANLHYAAIVLRTADLIHMTRDRTPTVQYRLTSPVDPIGQREWRKQQAVRAVKQKPAVDSQNRAIEVHARFDEPDGYFALMEYLDYCGRQLAQNQKWISAAQKQGTRAAKYQFPWTEIDREQIETVGFARKHFSFTFDQEKVLELLTGHTLYNDASVAIREITQNAIDAVRLQSTIEEASIQGPEPAVVIEYDAATRLLRVRDRGVGMSQESLLNHFLKVGSSSYQSSEFRERHPDFASISRFGIGVLSAFMIADEVRVATVTSADPVGRELVLKSVHGRYLIRDLDITSDTASRLSKRGTEVEMRLRPSSEFDGSILDLLRRWIILPRCRVVCRQVDSPEVNIGWDTPKEALEGLLSLLRLERAEDVRVIEKTSGATTIAIAQRWNPNFKEWDVLRDSRGEQFDEALPPHSDNRPATTGISIQGIRVTSELPGWSDSPFILADVSGPDAPRTNVARTDLEAGHQLDELVSTIYSALVSTIEDQVPEIALRGSNRLALREARQLFKQMTRNERGSRATYNKSHAMRRVLRKAQLLPVEVDSALQQRSSSQLQESGFEVLVGPAADDAARFMDWLPNPKGMMAILQEGGLLSELDVNKLPLLSGQDALFGFDQLLWEDFEICGVRALEGGRSLLIEFAGRAKRWFTIGYSREVASAVAQLSELGSANRFGRSRSISSWFASETLSEKLVLPADAEVFFVGNNRLFTYDSPFSKVYWNLSDASGGQLEKVLPREVAILNLIAGRVSPFGFRDHTSSDDFLTALEGWMELPSQSNISHVDDLLELARNANDGKVWSTSTAWRRRGESQMIS